MLSPREDNSPRISLPWRVQHRRGWTRLGQNYQENGTLPVKRVPVLPSAPGIERTEATAGGENDEIPNLDVSACATGRNDLNNHPPSPVGRGARGPVDVIALATVWIVADVVVPRHLDGEAEAVRLVDGHRRVAVAEEARTAGLTARRRVKRRLQVPDLVVVPVAGRDDASVGLWDGEVHLSVGAFRVRGRAGWHSAERSHLSCCH